MRKAFITGVQGQDGHYLSRLLLGEGTHVYGMGSSDDKAPDGVEFMCQDVRDSFLSNIPEVDEVYHLAAYHDTKATIDDYPKMVESIDINVIGTLNALDAAKKVGARFFNASSGAIFSPTGPYGLSKKSAHDLVGAFRKQGMFACNGILYNHESPLRPPWFVSQKICQGVADIVQGSRDKIVLENMNAVRDWSHAADIVRGMVAIIRHDEPRDFVLSSGVARSVAHICRAAFAHVGISEWRQYVQITGPSAKPGDVMSAEPVYAKKELGWETEISFEQMVGEMVDAALPASTVRVGFG